MDFSLLSDTEVIDSHIHFPRAGLLERLLDIMDAARLRRANLVAVPDLQTINQNASLLLAKWRQPDRFFICGALDYTQVWAGSAQVPQALAQQIVTLRKAGFDGLKLIEGKPMVRKILPIPFDGPEYAAMWATLEETGLPVVWHIADPGSFWDPVACPDWARAQGWFYGDGTYPLKEDLYGEVDRVMARHPGLRAIFAHFCFLSGDLARAGRFLDEHPHVCFDLTPGVEMYFDFARSPDAARDFFLRYQDRILFGSDIGASALASDAPDVLDHAESLGRAWVVRRFLEGEGPFGPPAGVGHWLGMDSGQFHGIALPPGVLAKIYRANWQRMAGAEPVLLNVDAALDLLRRQAAAIDALAGGQADVNPARDTAKQLQGEVAL